MDNPAIAPFLIAETAPQAIKDNLENAIRSTASKKAPDKK
jgi:hypothetical protein